MKFIVSTCILYWKSKICNSALSIPPFPGITTPSRFRECLRLLKKLILEHYSREGNDNHPRVILDGRTQKSIAAPPQQTAPGYAALSIVCSLCEDIEMIEVHPLELHTSCYHKNVFCWLIIYIIFQPMMYMYFRVDSIVYDNCSTFTIKCKIALFSFVLTIEL